MLTAVRRRAATAVLLTLSVAVTASRGTAADSGFGFQEQPGQHLDVTFDGRVVARYMTAFDPQRLDETAKPYLHVMDAAGKQPITKGLGGLYPHHRGIFIGYSRLTVEGQSYNLWGTSNVQVHQRFVEQQAAADQARFTSLVHWSTKDGTRLIDEERAFVFRAVEAPGLVSVEVSSKLTAVAGDTVLDGDPEHAGVQYRAADELDKTQTRYLFPAEGNDPRRDKDLPWAALSYVLDGQTYGVVQMNHPQNPKESVWSAYRDYARFGVFAKAEIARGQSLVLRYQFHIAAGELPAREQIQQRYDRYAS
jgi:hypothetical protein